MTCCSYYYGCLCLAIRVTDSCRCTLLNQKQHAGNTCDHPETKFFTVLGIFLSKASNSICLFRSAFVSYTCGTTSGVGYGMCSAHTLVLGENKLICPTSRPCSSAKLTQQIYTLADLTTKEWRPLLLIHLKENVACLARIHKGKVTFHHLLSPGV